MDDDSLSIPFATISHKLLLVAGAAVVIQPAFEGLKIFIHKKLTRVSVTTVTFCNPHQRIPEPSASFPSPQAQSRNLTVIPNSEHPFPITLDHSRPDQAQPDRLYLSLVSSSSLSLASSHMLPLPLSCSLRLTPLVLHLRQPYTT